MHDKSCSFCHIVAGADTHVLEVYRDEHVVAFFPSEPATLGHTLVVPKAHIRDIWSIDENTAAYLSKIVVRLANAVQVALEPEGINIIQSNGQAATQSVPHLHVHIVPRWTDDAVGRIWPPETNYSQAEKTNVLEKLVDEYRKMSMQ